jgi:CBS domain-containing protein
MQSIDIKDIIVPLAEYATVSQDATLYDAIKALAKAKSEFDQSRDKHRAILVLDDEDHVIGKLSQIDVIRGLEPGYKKLDKFPKIKHWALSSDALSNILKDQQLWQEPLKDLGKKSTTIHVSDIMHTPDDGEYVSQHASLDEAMHQLVVGQHQSLLVVDSDNVHKVIGILRLTDVFSTLVEVIDQGKN